MVLTVVVVVGCGSDSSVDSEVEVCWFWLVDVDCCPFSVDLLINSSSGEKVHTLQRNIWSHDQHFHKVEFQSIRCSLRNGFIGKGADVTDPDSMVLLIDSSSLNCIYFLFGTFKLTRRNALKFFKTLKELLQQSDLLHLFRHEVNFKATAQINWIEIHLFLSHFCLCFWLLYFTRCCVFTGAAANVKTSSRKPFVAAEEAECNLINCLQWWRSVAKLPCG